MRSVSNIAQGSSKNHREYWLNISYTQVECTSLDKLSLYIEINLSISGSYKIWFPFVLDIEFWLPKLNTF